MTVALLDTTVVIHLFRRYQPAVQWFAMNSGSSITSITGMEMMIGATNKHTQRDTQVLLNKFEVNYLIETDQRWAQQQIEQLRFSHNIRLADALIASVAYRLQVPLYTHNLKHMKPMLGALAVQPYT